jgi:hypothetical protein
MAVATKKVAAKKVAAKKVDELANFDDWSDEKKAAWAAENYGEEAPEQAAALAEHESFVQDCADVLGLGVADMELPEESLDDRYDRITSLQIAFDAVKTVQSIVSLQKITSTKVEGWKCVHRELLDRESGKLIETTSSSISAEVGMIFNRLVADLIELQGLDPVLWSGAEITKVRFPTDKGDGKFSDYSIHGVNPGAYGLMAARPSCQMSDCPPRVKENAKMLSLAICAWLERRILEATKTPLQLNLSLEKERMAV